MKTILALILVHFLSVYSAFSSDNCRIGINFINNDKLESFQIGNGSNLLIRSISDIEDSICLKVGDPYPQIIIINNDYYNYIPFYIHSGIYGVTIDVKNKSVLFNNSELNNEQHQLRNVYDSINKVYNIPKVFDLKYSNYLDSTNSWKTFNENVEKRDSIYDNIEYNFRQNHLNSYLSISYVYYGLYCDSKNVDKDKFRRLFYKLSPTLSIYPIYNEAKNLLDIQRPETAKPLWNGK